MTLAVAALILGAGGGVAPPASPNSGPSPLPRQPGCVAAGEANALCILILGDSIAVGVPVDVNERWGPQLRRQLDAALPGSVFAIDNWAVSGAQVAVLESAASDQPAVSTYDIAIVIEGVNDEQRMSAAEWQPRYEAAIAALEAKGVSVIVTTPPPSFENGAFGTRYDPFAAAVRSIASRGRPLLDIAGRWHADGPIRAGTYYADVIHQAAAGQELMASMARDVVLRVVGETARTQPAGADDRTR